MTKLIVAFRNVAKEPEEYLGVWFRLSLLVGEVKTATPTLLTKAGRGFPQLPYHKANACDTRMCHASPDLLIRHHRRLSFDELVAEVEKASVNNVTFFYVCAGSVASKEISLEVNAERT